MRLLILLFALVETVVSCNSQAPPAPPTTTPDFAWEQIGPDGGFVSTVVYHPSRVNEIWASGDDSSGLYKSTDAGNLWSLITTTPPDQSAYAMVFDPTDHDIVYAANHFGRGMLKTADAGTTWTIHVEGLPTAEEQKIVHDMAIDPNDSQTLYLALSGGLYRSADAGESFEKLTAAVFDGNADTSFRAVSISAASELFVGSKKGRVYKSTDGGQSWTELTAGGYLPISDIELSDNALYVAFQDGTITKSAGFDQVFSFVNNAIADGPIDSGLWTKIKSVSGADAQNDTLYIGTVFKVGSSKWGFFVSTDGGATVTKQVNGLDDSSTFDLAVNPHNTDEIMMATINNGIYKTTDQGLNWTPVSSGIQAQASLEFVENPADANHIIFSSTAGLAGTSALWETKNNGDTWNKISFFADKSVLALYIPPATPSTIIAGTFTNGIYKTTNSSTGPWTQVATFGANVRRIRIDAIDANRMYACSYQPLDHPDVGIYTSADAGDSWSKVSALATMEVVSHPTNTGEAIALTADVFATTDNFDSTFNSLGLNAQAPGQFFFSAAFIPGSPSSLLVGSSSGRLYRTDNYASSGVDVTWTEIPIPVEDVFITDLIADDADTWYLSCWIGDKFVRDTSTPGVMWTQDAGANWEFLTDGMFPSRLSYRLKKSHSIADDFFVGIWGGGFWRLSARR